MDLRIMNDGNGPHTNNCRVVKGEFIEINHPHGDHPYQIAIEDLHQPNGLADWIRQVSDKAWASPALVAEFATFAANLILLGHPLPNDNPTEPDMFTKLRAALGD